MNELSSLNHPKISQPVLYSCISFRLSTLALIMDELESNEGFILQAVLHGCRCQSNLKEFSNFFKYILAYEIDANTSCDWTCPTKTDFCAKWRLLLFMYFADYLAVRLIYMLRSVVRIFTLFDLLRSPIWNMIFSSAKSDWFLSAKTFFSRQMMAKTDRMFFFRLLRIQFITEISQFFQNHKQQCHSRWTAILLEYQAEDRAWFCHDVTHGMLSFSFFCA